MYSFEGNLVSLYEDMALVKKALSDAICGLDSQSARVPELWVLEAQGLKAIENFLWDMEQYFENVHAIGKDSVGMYTMSITREY
ncbi:hypothetical protein AMTR_s00027p00065240 [Amborella trichopoda]|uniref:Uncharacterized protein n=1 Tax=Amborella trichopoda TaxID=13333 RepID=W1PTV7_AMBTC|nr:hypothetical protein AMTR_s00027p00065240 [Amborella trichopoda]